MKNKLRNAIIALLALAFVCSCGITAFADEHSCLPDGVAQIPGDSEYHNVVCSQCGHVFPSKAPHSDAYETTDEYKLHYCSDCGYEIEKEYHDYTTEYNASGHYRKCTVCSHVTKPEPHDYVSGVCTVCSATEPEHSSGGGTSGGTPKVTEKQDTGIIYTVSGKTAKITGIEERILSGSEIVIDLSYEAGIVSAELTRSVFDEVVSRSVPVVLKMQTVSAEFDVKAVKSVADKAADNVTITVSSGKSDSLTQTQKAAVGKMDGAIVLELSVAAGNTYAGNFGAGKAKITAAFESDKSAAVWYLTPEGTTERLASTFDGEYVTFEVSHFSHYVIEKTADYSACTRGVSCPVSVFSDLKVGGWYHDGVHFCIDRGYMGGVGNGLFDPNGNTSRGMIVTMLFRMDGKHPAEKQSAFPDVKAGAWYGDAVSWAAENKIVGGYDDGNFGPDDDVTREQLAAILYRYAGKCGRDTSKTADISTFADCKKVSSYAVDAVKWATAQKIIGGKDGNRIDPTGKATRCEAAAMLQRFYENVMT